MAFSAERSAQSPIEGFMEQTDDTRERLLAAALNQFADRGFYGASIAQIAGELGLTKQALLYYFKRKEDLYAEVLRRISDRLLEAMHSGVGQDDNPGMQFEGMMLGIYNEAQARPLDTRVLLRELLDNQRRNAPEDQWYLKTFLDAVVAQLNKVEGMDELPFERKFASVYQMLSAIEYFTVSGQTLTRMYGKDTFARITEAYPEALREQVRRLIDGAGKS